MSSQIEQDAELRGLGRTALMIFRGAREDGSLMEAFWSTASLLLAIMKKEDE
jgi:hypothetical protein